MLVLDYTAELFVDVFHHLKLELLTQIPALNDEKITDLPNWIIWVNLLTDLLTQLLYYPLQLHKTFQYVDRL